MHIIIIIIIIIITELSCHSVAVLLTLARQNKLEQIYINETIPKHSTNNAKHNKYSTHYQNTHTIITKTPTCATCPAHHPLPDNTWSKVQITKLPIMRINPPSCNFLNLRSK
jgi:hypothetical protein